jgi:poly(3-hydroxybutyrate) depolymerase
MLIIHGDADDVVPYEATELSEQVGRARAAPAGARIWAQSNECASSQPRRDTLAGGRVLRDTWDSRCRAPVLFLTVKGADHRWPRKDRGAPIDAAEVIWEFFAHHRR